MSDNEDILPEQLRLVLAAVALNGLCSAIHDYSGLQCVDFDGIAADAVCAADALLRKLQEK